MLIEGDRKEYMVNQMRFKGLLERLKDYHRKKREAFGATYKALGFNSPEAQEIRFEQLLKVCEPSIKFSVNDYGCGYGAIFKYMLDKKYNFTYFGYDILNEMIVQAEKLFGKFDNCKFFNDESKLKTADYTIASGIFNVKFDTPLNEFREYILRTLKKIDKISKRGFAFNMLTKYSDFIREDLYYGDPCFFFDYCKHNFSKNVALLHDYHLYDFTITVRK